MRCCLLGFALVVLVGCEPKKVPSTSLMLRVQASETVRAQGKSLVIATTIAQRGSWSEQPSNEVSYRDIRAWPVDIPIEASEDADVRLPVEVVVTALGRDGNPLAQARAITSFVSHQDRVLELILAACDGLGTGGICEEDTACHGNSCLTCVDGKCVSTPNRAGRSLDSFDPDDPVEQIDAEAIIGSPPDAALADLEAGPPDDTDAGAAETMDSATPSSDDGAMEMETGASLAVEEGGTDSGSANDTGTPLLVDTGIDECEAARCTANGRDVELCKNGSWSSVFCDHACVGGRCVDCLPADRRCDPDHATRPQLCGVDGYWRADASGAPRGDCDGVCVAGRCQGDCRDDGTYRCSPTVENMRQQCVDHAWKDEGICSVFCRAGGCASSLSCGPASSSCASNVNCCNAHEIPGGSFFRSYDGVTAADQGFPATVGSFRLDTFEVTVARFRRWVEAYPASVPATGTGRNTRASNDQGWSAAWRDHLPLDTAALTTSLACDESATWTRTAGTNENKPITCVTWYMAQAFCIWDGGRLPTEAEWNFAAAGGPQQRVYAWSEPPSLQEVDDKHAVFGTQEIDVVGSRPLGHGLWKHQDLTGNAAEWVADSYRDPYAIGNCLDCVELMDVGCSVIRGGASSFYPRSLTSSSRDCMQPDTPWGKVGFRCARD